MVNILHLTRQCKRLPEGYNHYIIKTGGAESE